MPSSLQYLQKCNEFCSQGILFGEFQKLHTTSRGLLPCTQCCLSNFSFLWPRFGDKVIWDSTVLTRQTRKRLVSRQQQEKNMPGLKRLFRVKYVQKVVQSILKFASQMNTGWFCRKEDWNLQYYWPISNVGQILWDTVKIKCYFITHVMLAPTVNIQYKHGGI